jgi:two-component system, LytTR family, response regulator
MEQIQYDFFFADTCGQKIKIKFKDLAYVESAGNYALLIGNNFRTVVYSSLNSLMETFENYRFIRIHKSYVISVEYIEAIRGNECMMDVNGKKIALPIGVTYKKDLFLKLKLGK